MSSWISKFPENLRVGFSFIVHGVREGISSNRIIETLKTAGLGARRQTVLDVIRAVKEDLRAFQDVSRIQPRILPTLARIPDARTDIRRTFSYRFHIDELQDGQLVRRNVTLSTDSFLDFETAKDTMIAELEGDEFAYGRESQVTAISLVDVRKRASF